MSATPRLPFTFGAKLVAAVGLILLADVLFSTDAWPGATVGVFALAWTIVVVATNAAIRRDRRAWAAASLAAALALVLVEDPGMIAWGLFWTALAMAALLPRAAGFDDAWRWAGRLARHAAGGVIRPVRDAFRLRRHVPTSAKGRLRTLAPALILPVLGGGVFLALFAAANPIIEDVLTSLRGPTLDYASAGRVLFWGAVLIAVWPMLRPRLPKRRKQATRARSETELPGVTVTSVTLSLMVFNGLFLLQNGLDLVFLWSGAGLPEGMTLAEYAHRGAYPLIATALLAGVFVLVALRPGSETAGRFVIRRLVVLWIAQNVFLVASTMLRTLEYVEAYSLTRLRLAALVWMALVAVGLVLICWRLLRGKSAAWLINANAVAALAVLVLSAVVDYGAVAAHWNVRHAREVGGRGTELDLCYLDGLGGSALVALAKLEARPLPTTLRERVTAVRLRSQRAVEAAQGDWRSWTWRDARRLDRTQELTSGLSAPTPSGGRDCDGRLIVEPVRTAPPYQTPSPGSPSDDLLTPAPQP